MDNHDSNNEDKNSSGPRAESPLNTLPCPACQCDGTIEGRSGRALYAALKSLLDLYDRDYATQWGHRAPRTGNPVLAQAENALATVSGAARLSGDNSR